MSEYDIPMYGKKFFNIDRLYNSKIKIINNFWELVKDGSAGFRARTAVVIYCFTDNFNVLITARCQIEEKLLILPNVKKGSKKDLKIMAC